jgi:hypothetical protein
MTDRPDHGGDSPRELLSSLQQLTHGVRRAQRGTWFSLVLLGLALFMLAWAERHGALLAFAAAYLAAALLASFSGLPRRLLEDHGWAATPQTVFLPGLWLAASVLLAGGLAFAVAERRLRS